MGRFDRHRQAAVSQEQSQTERGSEDGAEVVMIRGGDEALSERDQTAADSEQTLADTDQTSSDTDQTSADRDQLAADRDQEASDRDLAAGVDPSVHELSRDIRQRTTEQ